MPASILNIGSCCIDHVYRVNHFVRPGETLASDSYEKHPGGKGLNQSVAIARAGGNVRHAGCIGPDGEWLLSVMKESGIDTSLIKSVNTPSGHANIQVNPQGENAIVLYGGSNRQVGPADIDEWIESCAAGDYLLLQNETSGLDTALELATSKGLRAILNAAPMTDALAMLPLQQLDTLIINELEGAALANSDGVQDIIRVLREELPRTNIVLTLGADGVLYDGSAGRLHVAAPEVKVIDTTGAGDTFTGYFIAGYSGGGGDMEEVLAKACKAAALSVTRPGAASSIPLIEEVDAAAL